MLSLLRIAGDTLRRPATLRALGLLLLASALWLPANALVAAAFPDRPLVPDLLFRLSPEIPSLAYASEPLILVSILVLLRRAFVEDAERTPAYLKALALGYALRALLMVLTPMARPTGNEDSYGLLEFSGVLQHGMFPSGHQMLACLAWLACPPRSASRRLAAAAALLQAAVLVLSRGHYAIDLVGGFLLAYFAADAAGARGDRPRPGEAR